MGSPTCIYTPSPCWASLYVYFILFIYFIIYYTVGDPYAAKAIGGGQQAINAADSAAASAAYGVVASANDPGIAAEAAYAAHAAEQATYNAAATYGAAAVYTGTARTH